MTPTNVSLMNPISVREGMKIFDESIKKFNAEPQRNKDGSIMTNKNGTPKPKKPSRQILVKDEQGKYIKDSDGKYVAGNMYDHVFSDQIREFANEDKQFHEPTKGGKLNVKTGKIEGGIVGRYNYMEELMQFGNSDTCPIGSPDGNLAIEGLKYFFNGIDDPSHKISIKPMCERLSQFKFIAAEIHNDEFHFREVEEGEFGEYVVEKTTKDEELITYTFKKVTPLEVGTHNRYKSTPHLHVCYIPWATGYTNGPDMQIGYNRSLEQMGFLDFEDYRDREREYMYEIADYVYNRKNGRGYDIKRNEKKSNKEVQHLSIPAYQKKRSRENFECGARKSCTDFAGCSESATII
jgi:hypothetical protein